MVLTAPKAYVLTAPKAHVLTARPDASHRVLRVATPPSVMSLVPWVAAAAWAAPLKATLQTEVRRRVAAARSERARSAKLGAVAAVRPTADAGAAAVAVAVAVAAAETGSLAEAAAAAAAALAAAASMMKTAAAAAELSPMEAGR
jgi:hypothetical protein